MICQFHWTLQLMSMKATLSDQEAMGISVSYTMGSMTLTANHNSIDNVAGTSTNDSGYAMSVGFAF